MKSLLTKENAEQIIERIQKLNTGSKPLWGKMDAAQMCLHCTKALQVPLGELHPKPNLFTKLFSGWIKKQILKETPYPRNSPTAPDFIVKSNLDLETEKQKLIATIRKFVALTPDYLNAKVHPTLGKMTYEEWAFSQLKHFEHHLSQFGV